MTKRTHRPWIASATSLAGAALVLGSALSATGALGCGPRTLPPTGQLLLYVNTDAPLPAAPGDVLGPNDPPALFDAVRIEISLPGQVAPCDGCSREFRVDRTLVGTGKASMGIVPTVGGSGYRARVRLLTSEWEISGEPVPESTLDTTVALPAVGEDGVTEVTVVLHTDDAGKVIGADTPVAPDPSPPEPGLVGTWPGAARVACPTAPGPDEACVPGGAYWMQETSLVVLSPFFLSRTEVTVAELRASGLQTSVDPGTDDEACTFTPKAGPNDGFPVVCVSWKLAREYCTSMGRDLMTTAQFEYVASGLEGHTYVWGEDNPSCGDATTHTPPDAEFGHSYYAAAGQQVIAGACQIFGSVSPPGSSKRDKLIVSGSPLPIVDIAGNTSEWGFEPFNADIAGCWGTGVFHDPVCKTQDPLYKGDTTLLGGSIVSGGVGIQAIQRMPAVPGVGEVFIGFRCARPSM